MKTEAEVLHESREYLANGWIQGELIQERCNCGECTEALEHDYDPIGVCSLGAILYSQGYNSEDAIEALPPVVKDAINRLAQTIRPTPWESETVPGRVVAPQHVIVDWNDSPERTKQEVEDMFAKAEKIALAGFDPDAP